LPIVALHDTPYDVEAETEAVEMLAAGVHGVSERLEDRQ